MPNWCLNEVRIDFSDEGVDIIKKLFVENKNREEEEVYQIFGSRLVSHLIISFLPNTYKFNFNKIIPVPLGDIDDDTIIDNRIEKWGTKWDVDDIELDEEDIEEGEIFLDFETAWSPPLSVLKHLDNISDYIDVWGFYREDGCQICGYMHNEW